MPLINENYSKFSHLVDAAGEIHLQTKNTVRRSQKNMLDDMYNFQIKKK